MDTSRLRRSRCQTSPLRTGAAPVHRPLSNWHSSAQKTLTLSSRPASAAERCDATHGRRRPPHMRSCLTSALFPQATDSTTAQASAPHPAPAAAPPAAPSATSAAGWSVAAERAVSLSFLCDFYEQRVQPIETGLGRRLTTGEVVARIIIPETQEPSCRYADLSRGSEMHLWDPASGADMWCGGKLCRQRHQHAAPHRYKQAALRKPTQQMTPLSLSQPTMHLRVCTVCLQVHLARLREPLWPARRRSQRPFFRPGRDPSGRFRLAGRVRNKPGPRTASRSAGQRASHAVR